MYLKCYILKTDNIFTAPRSPSGRTDPCWGSSIALLLGVAVMIWDKHILMDRFISLFGRSHARIFICYIPPHTHTSCIMHVCIYFYFLLPLWVWMNKSIISLFHFIWDAVWITVLCMHMLPLVSFQWFSSSCFATNLVWSIPFFKKTLVHIG